jgi:tRNA pseudouridine-54 N-methylase
VRFPCVNGKNNAAAVSGTDDYMLRLGRTVHEVPLPQRPFFAFDDEQGFAGEDKKVLLVGSQWYIAIGSPGLSTVRPIPICEKSVSPVMPASNPCPGATSGPHAC